eukprot:Sdes_comp21234_c0_seq1m19888
MSDLCECICGHINMMVRLLQMLRTSSNCNGSECVPDLTSPFTSSEYSTLQIFLFWVIFGYVMYLYRPSSLRNGSSNERREDTNGKPHFNHENNNFPPPSLD